MSSANNAPSPLQPQHLTQPQTQHHHNMSQPQQQVQPQSQPASQPQSQPQQQTQSQPSPQPPTSSTNTPTSDQPTPPSGGYMILLAPNPRQPGVQNIRYPQFISIPRHGMMAAGPGATIIQRAPALIRGVAAQPGMGVHSTVIPTSQPYGIAGMQPTMSPQTGPIIHQPGIISPQLTAPSQMTLIDALTKGINFFTTLLTRVEVKSRKIVVQNLIQALIDGRKTSAEFASELQKELKSAPQNQLVPFLDLMLPQLRQSMASGQTRLPGIRSPTIPVLPTAQMHQPGPTIVTSLPSTPSTSIAVPPSTITQTPTPSTSGTPPVTPSTTPAKKKKVPLPPGQKSAYAIKKEAREARKRERELAAAAGAVPASNSGASTEKVDDKPLATETKTEKPPQKSKPDKPRRPDKKKQEKKLESLSSALRDDDDVNDVAAMGGVNLAEESQKIMASGAELVGTQIRSCKDEPFLDVQKLTERITRITKQYNLADPSKEIITLVSHATQECLKEIVERLGVLAEHRSENLKLNPKYEISNDIKGQMKFLAELDRIEKRRYEEQERELLNRIAKSRSKVEDPEQQKLRQKAKDMQRAEQEEVRQREANQTALLALGPRKKLKTNSDASSSMGSFESGSIFRETKPNLGDLRTDTYRRLKRVNLRDLQVLFELDRTHLNRLIKISVR